MTNRMNRRRFLKNAGATGIGFWIAGCAGEMRRTKSPNEKLDVAGIGVGGKGEVDVGQCAGENIVALCDADEARAAGTIKKFPKAKIYRDFRKMFDEMGKGIDAVTVSTPDHTHAVAAVMAMKLGKHVYCQKPLTHTIHEARVMLAVARETKVATQMGNQGHANAQSRRLVELIQGGVLGKVRDRKSVV